MCICIYSKRVLSITLFFFLFLDVNTFAIIQTSNYINIVRTTLSSITGEVITQSPQGWLSRALRSIDSDNSAKIREVIYVPSPLSLVPFDSAGCIDDEHFCSILCEKGFVVHTLSLGACLYHDDRMKALSEIIKIRMKSIPPRCIAIVAHELSVVSVLTYLADIALPMAPERVDIGAVVLVDPPPLACLTNPDGRKTVFERYISSFYSADCFKENICQSYESTEDLNRMYMEYRNDVLGNCELLRIISSLRAAYNDTTTNVGDVNTDADRRLTLELELLMDAASLSSTTVKPSSRKSRGRFSKNMIFSAAVSTMALPVESDDGLLCQLLGDTPRNALGVGRAMLNRILVVDTGRFFPTGKIVPLVVVDPLDDWGLASVEEVTELYSAGPLVSLRADAEPDFEDGSDLAQHRIHRGLAGRLADWFILLSRFSYI